MATLQKIKPCQSTFQSNWKTIFPDFTTLTGSGSFIKKLMAVSVSAITYLRGIFPENAFGERNLCGIKLKLLTEQSGIESVDKFIDFVRSCYEAIDKKYLHQVSIGICTDPNNREEVLESYNINFRYSDDECGVNNQMSSMMLMEDDPTVQSTLMLLKSILCVTDLLSPLPKEAYITMKIIFNDDITPPDYQLPGFIESDVEKFHFPPNAVKLALGNVSTDFNNYKMFLKTVLSKESLSQIYEESILTGSQPSQNNEEEPRPENCNIPSQTKVSLKSSDDFVITKHEESKMECICSCKENLGTKLLQCEVCGKKQHSVCYGILKPHEIPSEFYCTMCFSEAPYNLSQEDVIYRLEGNEQKELCAMRRALVFCSSLKQVTPFQLEKGLKCDKQLMKDMLAKLEEEGFVKKSGQKYLVNGKKIIAKGHFKYFSKTEAKENIENIEEAIPSPEIYSDDEDLDNKKRGLLLQKSYKKKSTFTTGETSRHLPEEHMDLAIEDEVEKLSLRGSQEKQTTKLSRRRSLKKTMEDEEETEPPKNPRKRRCMNKKDILNYKK